MKLLYGSELADFIKERQAKQVRALRQAHGIFPKLAIVQTKNDKVIDLYVRLKKQYGQDILVDVEQFNVSQDDVPALIDKLNKDNGVQGIIIQLPLSDPFQTDAICDLIAKNKDVDALCSAPIFDAATPTAIAWLLAGYNIDLRGKQILVVGQGKLVGRPLVRLFQAQNLNITTADRSTTDLKGLSLESDIIISATGSPGIITESMLKEGAVAIDAGSASEDGTIVGDLHPNVYTREDLILTPQKGGVGPLTICALFDNLIKACNLEIQR